MDCSPERRAGEEHLVAGGSPLVRRSSERRVGSPEGREPESTGGNESLWLGFGLEAFF
jgi:hypothetical protein